MRDVSSLSEDERFAAAEELEWVADAAAANSLDLSLLTQHLLGDLADELRLASSRQPSLGR